MKNPLHWSPALIAIQISSASVTSQPSRRELTSLTLSGRSDHPTCQLQSQKDVIGAELDAVLEIMDAAVTRLSPLRPGSGHGATVGDPYFSTIFDVGERSGTQGPHWVDEMTSYYSKTLRPLVKTTQPNKCGGKDNVCTESGVAYDAAAKAYTFCDSWFDDNVFPSTKQVETHCKGEHPKFYSLKDVQNSKGIFTSPFPLPANKYFVAQAIINALVREVKYKSKAIQGQNSPIDAKPVDLAINLLDSLKLAAQSLAIPGSRGTQSRCPSDTTKSPKSYPYRCSLWNVRQWGLFAQGNFRQLVLLDASLLTGTASYFTAEKSFTGEKKALQDQTCGPRKFPIGICRPAPDYTSHDLCLMSCEGGACSENSHSGYSIGFTSSVALPDGKFTCSKCPEL